MKTHQLSPELIQEAAKETRGRKGLVDWDALEVGESVELENNETARAYALSSARNWATRNKKKTGILKKFALVTIELQLFIARIK